MITKDNLIFAFENLNKDDIHTALKSHYDFIVFSLCHFNVGSYSHIEAMDYCEEVEQEETENGNIFTTKDNFLSLYKESGAKNETLEEYI